MAEAPRTLFDKIWQSHLAHRQEDGTSLLYVDRHLVHEVTSPQAFEGLRMHHRKVRRPEATLAALTALKPAFRPDRHGDDTGTQQARRYRRRA